MLSILRTINFDFWTITSVLNSKKNDETKNINTFKGQWRVVIVIFSNVKIVYDNFHEFAEKTYLIVMNDKYDGTKTI